MSPKTSSHFETLPLGAVRPIGWLQAQLRRDLTEGFAGCLDALTARAATDLFTHRIASSSQQFAWWDSETRGNWLWGYTLMAFLADLPEHQARVITLLEALKNTQDRDGYLGIYAPASRYAHGESENGELWAQSRAVLALLTYYEFSGDATYLDAARRAVDLTLAHYSPDRPYFCAAAAIDRDASTGLTHGLCYVDVVEWLYPGLMKNGPIQAFLLFPHRPVFVPPCAGKLAGCQAVGYSCSTFETSEERWTVLRETGPTPVRCENWCASLRRVGINGRPNTINSRLS